MNPLLNGPMIAAIAVALFGTAFLAIKLLLVLHSLH